MTTKSGHRFYYRTSIITMAVFVVCRLARLEGTLHPSFPRSDTVSELAFSHLECVWWFPLRLWLCACGFSRCRARSATKVAPRWRALRLHVLIGSPFACGYALANMRLLWCALSCALGH